MTEVHVLEAKFLSPLRKKNEIPPFYCCMSFCLKFSFFLCSFAKIAFDMYLWLIEVNRMPIERELICEVQQLQLLKLFSPRNFSQNINSNKVFCEHVLIFHQCVYLQFELPQFQSWLFLKLISSPLGRNLTSCVYLLCGLCSSIGSWRS